MSSDEPLMPAVKVEKPNVHPLGFPTLLLHPKGRVVYSAHTKGDVRFKPYRLIIPIESGRHLTIHQISHGPSVDRKHLLERPMPASLFSEEKNEGIWLPFPEITQVYLDISNDSEKEVVEVLAALIGVIKEESHA